MDIVTHNKKILSGDLDLDDPSRKQNIFFCLLQVYVWGELTSGYISLRIFTSKIKIIDLSVDSTFSWPFISQKGKQ